MLKIHLGYPALSDEIHILELQQLRHPIEIIESVATEDELRKSQEAIKTVYVSPAVKRYVVELTRATRTHADVYLGASPRGSLGLFRAGQAIAAIAGREYVLPDDIKSIAVSVLAHRMVVNPATRMKDISAPMIIEELLSNTPIPSGEFSLNVG